MLIELRRCNNIFILKKLLLILFLSGLFANSQPPIILVHGFFGWGRDEMLGYYYWGGSFDLEDYLREQGFTVYTASVGPVSSNWDRAVELYTQIKGGQVDYGNAHSEEFGLVQKPDGKVFEGFYPDWDAEHPVHIIGHSQGGTTARMLEYLLQNSFGNEDSNLLKTSYDGWIKSITTISTPHDGTTLAPIMNNIFPFAQKMAKWLGVVNNNKIIEKFFNLDLEQWGLERKEKEPYSQYMKRIANLPFDKSTNFSAWDLSIEGARDFNSIYTSDDSTYYFSITTTTTHEKKSGNHVPDGGTFWYLWSPAYTMGRDKNAPNSKWFENDGVVNTISMAGPTSGRWGAENIVYSPQEYTPGVWQVIANFKKDHHAFIRPLSFDEIENTKDFFYNHCKTITALP